MNDLDRYLRMPLPVNHRVGISEMVGGLARYYVRYWQRRRLECFLGTLTRRLARQHVRTVLRLEGVHALVIPRELLSVEEIDRIADRARILYPELLRDAESTSDVR